MGYRQIDRYISEERNRVMDAYNKMVAAPTNDALKDSIRILANIELTKKMDYIRHNGHQYYSYFSFAVEYINSRLYPVDTLLSIFHQTFPSEIKNSPEGKETLAYLMMRKLREQEQVAPDFSATDIKGTTISLSQYKGKYVLLNFWASWCVPCVKELPALNELTATIPEDKMIRIFITQDSDTTAFEKAKTTYNLTGIHLYATTDLITKYKAFAIPRLYLINKEGKIIYDRKEGEASELPALAEVIKKTPDLQ